jgi:hypothetical protein
MNSFPRGSEQSPERRTAGSSIPSPRNLNGRAGPHTRAHPCKGDCPSFNALRTSARRRRPSSLIHQNCEGADSLAKLREDCQPSRAFSCAVIGDSDLALREVLQHIARAGTRNSSLTASGLQNSFVQNYRFQVSRGAVTTITGSGFAPAAQTADPPFPLSLGGVELHVGGITVPIAAVSPTSMSFPATWDLPGDAPVDIEVWVSSASASRFVPGFEVEPALLSPSLAS